MLPQALHSTSSLSPEFSGVYGPGAGSGLGSSNARESAADRTQNKVAAAQAAVAAAAAAERWAALRVVRDGLRRQDDHLNLCRKKAYTILMCGLASTGGGAGIDCDAGAVREIHAVVDVFERACCIPQGARYLLERVCTVLWLHGNIVQCADAAGAPSRAEVEAAAAEDTRAAAKAPSDESDPDRKVDPVACH
jgi:hypothetical protein